jgi:hypothetical protein
MVTPAAERTAVARLVDAYGMSERRACTFKRQLRHPRVPHEPGRLIGTSPGPALTLLLVFSSQIPR